MRRCREDREDFGPKDAAFFPIYLRRSADKQPMGTAFGFCPGKSTWYPDVQKLFDLLVLSAETGQPLFAGGLAEQPEWAAEAMAWFIPQYLELQFLRRARAVFGGKDKPEATGNGANDRRPNR